MQTQSILCFKNSRIYATHFPTPPEPLTLPLVAAHLSLEDNMFGEFRAASARTSCVQSEQKA